MELSQRKRKILQTVVELYVESGVPVGSKSVCDHLDFPVSSATVRNELSDLSELGLLDQPHTSAGRVPSHRGYRLYVDQLMKPKTLGTEERRIIDSLLLSSAYDPEKLLNGVSRALAALTRCTAVSTTPGGGDAAIRAVQFVQTSRRTAMVVLITSAGTMKTRVFHCEFDITPEILRVFFRTINEKLVGRPVSDITPAFIQGLAASLGEMAILMSSALMAVLDVARESMEADVCLSGEMNLMLTPEYEISGVHRVLDFLSRPEELTRLLLESGGTRILIGRESRRPELYGTSMVISRYTIGGRDAGAVAVIGPPRMNYGRVLASVGYLSDAVGRMLTELLDAE